MKAVHHFRWRSPRHVITCGVRNGLINPKDPSDITCKRCVAIMKKRGWMKMEITVDNGKYTFIDRGSHIEVLRHKEPWHTIEEGQNAIRALMADAAFKQELLGVFPAIKNTDEPVSGSDLVEWVAANI